MNDYKIMAPPGIGFSDFISKAIRVRKQIADDFLCPDFKLSAVFNDVVITVDKLLTETNAYLLYCEISSTKEKPLLKLTIKPNGQLITVTPLFDGVEIEFVPKCMDLWKDKIEMWLHNENEELTDYASFTINKNNKAERFIKS